MPAATHRWPGSSTLHTISWQQHLANEAAAAAQAQSQANAARQRQQGTVAIGNAPVTQQQWQNGTLANALTGPAASTEPATITVTPPPPPPLDPFFTPEDIQAMGGWLRTVDDNRTAVDSQLNTTASDTKYQTGQLNQQAKQTVSQVQDNMVERGLFQSSVKDAALFDVEAQRATQEGLFSDRLKQVTTEHDNWVGKYGGTMSNGVKIAGTQDEAKAGNLPLGTAVASWYGEWQGKAGQNALEANAGRPAPLPITVPNPAYKPAPAAAPAKGITIPTAAAPLQQPANVATGSGTANKAGTTGTATLGTGPTKPKKKKTYTSGVTSP